MVWLEVCVAVACVVHLYEGVSTWLAGMGLWLQFIRGRVLLGRE